MAYIEAKNLCKTFDVNGVITEALKNVNFKIKKGTLVVILGPSGAGKTTLLNMIGGMDYITSGNLEVDGTKLFGLDKKNLTLYRRKDVGFVFQFYNLMANLTAKENIELATEICKDALDVDLSLRLVGLEDKKDNFPSQLSGGQQQRISIARAIAKNPKLLLCDEPTGALDIETGKQILKLLNDLVKKEGKTIIIVTHNAAIKDLADHVLYIKNGTIEKEEFNYHPKTVEEISW